MSEQQNDGYMFCYKHPDRQTLLRCNKCGRPMCLDCAVQTPTGYRCKECIREQQKVFDTSEKKDYIIGGALSAVLAIAGSYVEDLIPLSSFFIPIIVGVVFGRLICAAVRKAVGGRRSKNLNIVITAAAAAAVILVRWHLLEFFFMEIFSGYAMGLLNGLINLLLRCLYAIVLCLTMWMEMSGMVFRR